jgi:putative transcriptional regulator
MFHYTSCGLPNVWLRNGYREVETAYGKGVAIDNLEGLHNAIGLFLVEDKPRLTGAEVRFLRKELDLSQATLAKMLGVAENSIRHWESGRGRITKPAERVLRLLYREHACGNCEEGSIRNLIERLGELNRDLYANRRKFELEEAANEWKTAA